MKWGNWIRGLLESISSSVLINSISHLRTTLMSKPILHGDRDRYMIKHNDSSCANLFRAFGKAWLIFLIAVYSATCWGNIVANYILVCTYISPHVHSEYKSRYLRYTISSKYHWARGECLFYTYQGINCMKITTCR